MTADPREQLAWAYLSRVAEPPCPPLAALVADVGPVEAADRVRRGEVDRGLLGNIRARSENDCAADDLETLKRRDGRLITPQDQDWPGWALLAFSGERAGTRKPEDHPPLVLWALGPQPLADVTTRAVAMVGTRACTNYGEHVTGELATGLVEHGVAIISGGAFGIDGAAHRAALAADGTTVAVLAGGIDVPYPAGHSALLHRVAAGGLVLSEYPPGVRPARYRFLTRNRLVAALSGATVVVEAGLRSGAANTAAWARTFGRTVCAVPGPVTSAASAGCHELLRHHRDCVLVTRAPEIVEVMGRIGELAEEQVRPTTSLDGLTPVQQRVYEAFPRRAARSADEIAVASGLPTVQVLGQFALLELGGLLERHDGLWRIARAEGDLRHGVCSGHGSAKRAHGYGLVTKALHWGTVIAVVTQFVIGLMMEADDAAFERAEERLELLEEQGEDAAERGGEAGEEAFDVHLDRLEDDLDAREDDFVGSAFTDLVTGAAFGDGVSPAEVHVLLGLTLLALGLVRVLWRATTPLPPWAPYLSARERSVESAAEKVLLTSLFLVPLSGLLLVWVDADWLWLHIGAQLVFLASIGVHVALVLRAHRRTPEGELRRML